jgi:D-inositol-3-phosphate glycosyltransferase
MLAHALNRAMSTDARVHALWVGHGKSEPALRDVATLGGSPTRHHWKPWLDDVRPAYAAMDIVALPSVGSETFGSVLVEAQSCGLPVLGARNGGIPEALADGQTGLLLPKQDVEGWANAIADLASNEDRRRQLAASARDFALRFDGRHVVDEFVRVLDWLSPARRESATREPRARIV